MDNQDSFTLDSKLLEKTVLEEGEIFLGLIDRMEQEEGEFFTLQFFMNYLQLISIHYFFGLEDARNNTLTIEDLKKTIEINFQMLQESVINRLTSMTKERQSKAKTLH